MTWKTLKDDGKIDFSGFECDEPILNDYLHQKAQKDQADDLATLYFLVNDSNVIGGFFVLSSGSIRRQNLPNAKARKNLPGYPLGTIHIGRLARQKEMVKQQLGDRLILAAFEVALKSAGSVAAFAITVDAKNSRAEAYYAKYGFVPLTQDPEKLNEYPKAMYLRMKDARYTLNKR